MELQNNRCETNQDYHHLAYALKHGDHGKFKYLISHGASINSCDAQGDNLLIYVFSDVFSEEVKKVSDFKLLMSLGINVNNQNNLQDTALHWLCNHAKKDFILELIKANADINIQNSKNWTPVMYAVFSHKLEFVDYFLNLNLDINFDLINNDNETVLDMATRQKNVYPRAETIKIFEILKVCQEKQILKNKNSNNIKSIMKIL